MATGVPDGVLIGERKRRRRRSTSMFALTTERVKPIREVKNVLRS
jgi:hypothetical protein